MWAPTPIHVSHHVAGLKYCCEGTYTSYTSYNFLSNPSPLTFSKRKTIINRGFSRGQARDRRTSQACFKPNLNSPFIWPFHGMYNHTHSRDRAISDRRNRLRGTHVVADYRTLFSTYSQQQYSSTAARARSDETAIPAVVRARIHGVY